MEKEAASVRHWKVLLSFVLVFALLGGAYFFIQNYDPTEKPAEITPTPTIGLLSLEARQVMQVEIQNTAGQYAFVRDGEGWLVKNEPYIELYTSRVETLCFGAATLSADTLVAAAAPDVSVYGLDKPQSVVTLMLDSGDTVTFKIGNLTPAGDGYYACLAESTDVYILSTGTGSQFCSPLSAFRVMTITMLNQMDIRSITITRDGEPFKVVYVAPPEGSYPGAVSTWHIESPIRRDADNALVQEKLLTPLSTLVAAGVAADNPEDLSAFGFEGDSVEISTETETVRFTVGTADGASFIMVDGKQVVYFMGNGTLSFMEVTPFDILEKMTNLIAIDTVDTIEATLPGGSAALRVSHEGENMRYFVNDTPAGEEAFKAIYVELAALSVDGMITGNADMTGKTPAASIVYTLTDGSTTTLAYYPYDDFNYAVAENSECTFYIKKTKITELGEKLQDFVQNPNG